MPSPSHQQPALWLALAAYRALCQSSSSSASSSLLSSSSKRSIVGRGKEVLGASRFSSSSSSLSAGQRLLPLPSTSTSTSSSFALLKQHDALSYKNFTPPTSSFSWTHPQRHGTAAETWRGYASSAAPSPRPATEDDENETSSTSPLAAPSLSQSSSSSSSSPTPTTIIQQPSADLCDFALSELDTTRSKLESASRSTYKPRPWPSKIASVAASAASAAASLVSTVAASPARVASFFLTKSKKERREIYAGWWSHAKAEARHYWAGTKLLWAEVKIASRLVAAAARGRALTRRERRQLTRTVADVFRLVPVAVFLVVPFMEFLLPIALKLFPNMLPSTFETALQREEALKRRVKAKLEVARFLQDTVAELAKDMKNSSRSSGATQASAAELYAFMKRVRGGEPVTAAEVTRFASLFSDELTLDNLDRTQLTSLCRFAGIQPFGTDAFLASRLRSHLASIKRDDKAIRDEGLSSLSDDELRSACRARGMRAPFGEGARLYMERQMEEWLDLSLARQLPSSLLLLSRAFTVTAPYVVPVAAEEEQKKKVEAEVSEQAAAATTATKEELAAATTTTTTVPAVPSPDVVRLRETLGVLPDEAIEAASLEAAAAAGTAEGAAASDKAAALERKLESLRREEELIEEEAKDAAAAAEALLASSSSGEEAGLDASRLLTATTEATPATQPATTTATTAPASAPSIDTAADALAAGAAAAVVREAKAAAKAAEAAATAASSAPRRSSISEPPVDFDFVGGESAEERAALEAARKEERMKNVLSALAALASTSGVAAERGEFMDLVKKEVDRLNAEASARGAPSLLFSGRGRSGAAVAERPLSPEELVSSTPGGLGAARLSGRVPAILARIERELDAVDARIGEKMHVLDEDNDGVISEAELKRALGFLRESLGEDELRTLLERLQRAKGGESGRGEGRPASTREALSPFQGDVREGDVRVGDDEAPSPLASAAAASGFDVAHLMQLAAEESKKDAGSDDGGVGEKKV